MFSLGGIMRGNFGLFWNLVGNNAALFKTTDIIETSVYRMIVSQNNFTSSTAVGLYQSLFGFALIMIVNWIVRRINEDYALF
jgi:putative aldouronate transport system permease protein